MTDLTKEDCMNINKWLTTTEMMIEARLRIPLSDSELKTWEKIKEIEGKTETETTK